MLYVFFINLVQLNIGRREYIGLHKQSSRPGQASQVAHERRPALEHGTYVPSPVPASVAAGDGRGVDSGAASCFPRTFPPTRSSVPDDTRLTSVASFVHLRFTRRRVHFFFSWQKPAGEHHHRKTTIRIHQHDGPQTKRKLGYDGEVSSRKRIRRGRRVQWANSLASFSVGRARLLKVPPGPGLPLHLGYLHPCM